MASSSIGVRVRLPGTRTTARLVSNFNKAGRRLWWRGRTLQSIMDYRGPRLHYPQSQPTRAHPPRFDYRDPDASDDDVGDYDGYSGDVYRARHDYD
jgi:hypothetical protein